MGTGVLERTCTADELTSAMGQLHALSMATWRELLAQVAEYDRCDWLRRYLPDLGAIPKLAFDPG